MITLKKEKLFERVQEYSGYVLSTPFVIDEENHSIEKIINEIDGNEVGLIVMGNPGAGKTILMEMVRNCIYEKDSKFFKIVNAIDFVKEFNLEGHKIFNQNQNSNICIDDLGTEETGHFFQETVDVFSLYIQFRYNLFKRRGIKTHFTSNLTFNEISERYGLRCKSRMQEMCNLYYLGASENYTDRRNYRNFKTLPKVFYKTAEWEEEQRIKKGYKKLIENPPTPTTRLTLGQQMKEKFGFKEPTK